ncbi:MAG: helix-turn-helix domain-containing protein [Candidatus Woesearchaeota archaeon]|nr:helix-turn-helix domain-containing protein [Candidatus Woesearchaeota archaeon]
MFKAQFHIYHKTCWGSAISIQFPEHEFSSVDCRWVKQRVAHILLARGAADTFNDIVHYLKKRTDVTKVEMLSKDEHTIYIRVVTKKDRHTSQFSDIFFAHECFPVVPTRFEGKYEIWTLGTAVKKNITAVYTDLKQHHPLKMTLLTEETIATPLTKKQRDVLNYAKHFGYYEWPRKMSVTKMAKAVHMPKTVFLSHLRKAEKKVIHDFVSK